MKQIFDLFTRAEIEIIVNTGKLSEEQKALFKREGIAFKEAINYAKEVLKYLPSDEAEETEEFDEENYFADDSDQDEQDESDQDNDTAPTSNSKQDAPKQDAPKQETPTQDATAQEEETQPEELMQEISEVVSPQQEQKRTGRTALERMKLLDRLEELKEKHDKTVQMITRIAGMTKEHNESEGVTVSIQHSKFPSITISKNLAVKLCLNFVFEETDKQRKAIENEIENLDF